MIMALRKAYARQKRRMPFGPIDIRFLHPLIERELIVLAYYVIGGEQKSTWYLTKKGVHVLYSINTRNSYSRRPKTTK
jgi:hypothetical protein